MSSTDLVIREAVDSTVIQLRDPAFEEQVALALPDGTNAKRFLRVAATAALENPDLALADRASLIKAVLKCASDGLLPDGRQAALIVRQNRQKGIDEVSYQPMIGGVRAMLAEFGWALTTAVIYENDVFEDHTAEGYVEHRRPRLGEDRGKPIGAWAMAQHERFGKKALVYDESQIQDVRKKTSKTDKVWNTWPDQMREKTVGHRLSKTLPLDPKDRERIDRVLAVEGDDGVTMLYGEDTPPSSSGDVGALEAGTPPTAAREPDQQAAAASRPDPAAAAPGPDEMPFEEPPPPSEPITFPTALYAGKPLRYAGKTLQETFDAGADGVTFLRWAMSSWKSEPLRSALDRFAEEHPEIKS